MDAIQIVTDLGEGLTAMHERGILHRDLKRINCLVHKENGAPRGLVADYGFAKDASGRTFDVRDHRFMSKTNRLDGSKGPVQACA